MWILSGKHRFMVILAMLALFTLPGELDAKLVLSTAVQTWEVNNSQQALNQGEFPDRAGLISDTRYFISYQFLVLGIIYMMPEDVSGWSSEQKHGDPFDKWAYNVTHPHWDRDKWYINYIAHPYFGAAYYVRARERGYDPDTSFWYSNAMSLSWELGLEAMAERVSIQDVIVTPTFGKLVGDYFMKIRRPIVSRPRITHSYGDKLVLFVTDPIGSFNDFFRHRFGWHDHLQIRLSGTGLDRIFQPLAARDASRSVALSIEFHW